MSENTRPRSFWIWDLSTQCNIFRAKTIEPVSTQPLTRKGTPNLTKKGREGESVCFSLSGPPGSKGLLHIHVLMNSTDWTHRVMLKLRTHKLDLDEQLESSGITERREGVIERLMKLLNN